MPRTLALVWDAAGRWMLIWSILLTAQGVVPALIAYLTKSFVDSMVAAAGAGHDWTRIRPALIYAALVASSLLLLELLRNVTSFVRAAQSELLTDHISALIQQKSVAADFAFYELPEYYNHLHRARSDASYRSVALIESLGNLLRDFVTLFAMLVVLLPFGWWLPLSLLVATLPSVLVVLIYTLRRYEWQRQVTETERRTWYYDWVLTSGETAAEIRLFGLGAYFQNAYVQLRRKLRGEQLHMAKQQSAAEFGAALLAMLITGGTLAWMVWQALQGTASLGTLALFYQAFNQGLQLLRSLLGNFNEVYANGLFLSDLFEFLDMQPQVKNPDTPVPAPIELSEGIEFREVTFRYPSSKRAALDNFNLTLPAGQVVAIVGLNGAGKTTLIKLLCRLYDPDAGSITIDGVDLRQMRLDELRRLITVLFQEPVRYSATVAENICLGALDEALPGEQLRAAAREAGVTEVISRLPQGYGTLLGKWFSDGAELSTGQWQRLALARAFVRQAPILLLDEPTSAMDSWAEADWRMRLRRVVAGRTTLIITHRFTTAMQADMIHVMVDGRIIEAGTHQQLLAVQGRYAQSWLAQTAEVAS